MRWGRPARLPGLAWHTGRVHRRWLIAPLALALLALAPAAGAAATPVQQFSVQLKNPTPDGRYSVVFTANSFDTSGGPPPSLSAATMRFARGMSIRRSFLDPDRLCETGKLRATLLDAETKDYRLPAMLKNLAAAQQRISRRLSYAGRRVLDRCLHAQIGRGSFLLDARPNFADPIPGFMYVFLSPPSVPGAIAGFGVMSYYDQRAPIVRNTWSLTDQQPGFTMNIFEDAGRDGRYGYRVEVLPKKVARFQFSVAEMRVQSGGPKDRRTGAFWATPPACPPSGRISFRADYRYADGQRSSQVLELPCRRFRR